MQQARSMNSEEQRIRAWNEQKLGRFDSRTTNLGGVAVLEISILDVIGLDYWWSDEGITSKRIQKVMEQSPGVSLIRALINSPGGYTDEGLAIQALLKRHAARVECEVLGMMASAATLVALGGDTIKMHQGAYAMIHQASTCACGTVADLEAGVKGLLVTNESIINLYRSRNGKTDAEVREAVMNTTYFTAEEAVAWGLADEVIPVTAGPVKPAATPPPEPEPEPVEDDGKVIVASYKRRRPGAENLIDNRGSSLLDRPQTMASERRERASRLV